MRRMHLRALLCAAALAAPLQAQEPADSPSPPASPPASPFSGGMPGQGGPGGGPMGNGYRVVWLPSQAVSGQNSKLGFVQQDLSVACPIYMDGPDMLLATARIGSDTFQTDATLPNSTQAFPEQFWNVSLGVMGFHRCDNGWTFGASVSAGSASNKPFENFEQLNANVLAFLRVPAGERDSWNFALIYSPLGQLPFPIPGVSYFWQPCPEFSLNIGLPFQLRYRPADDWTIELSYMVLTNVRARATYQAFEAVSIYGGFEWINQVYHLSTPETSSDRFYYYEKRLAGGALVAVRDWLTIDLSTGYAFDRFYSEGNLFGANEADRLGVGDGPFVSCQARLRW